MLVLTRKKGENIFIGDDIEVSIIGIDGDRVRIGIEAPMELEILRGELLDETKELNRQAANTSTIKFSDITKLIDKK